MDARTKIRPTKRALALGCGTLVVFAVGANVQAGWVLAVAALLAGCLVSGALLASRGLAGVQVSRHVPPTASAGSPVAVGLSVANRGRRLRGLIAVADEFCGRGAAVVRIVGPGAMHEYAAMRTGARRGVYAGGPCTVETGAPFGVLRVTRTSTLTSPIVVYPKIYPADPARLAGAAGWRTVSPLEDVSSVRDYRHGDPVRHIHWRSTARVGRLMVREFDAGRREELTIAVEVPDDADVADAVASIACSVAIAWLRDSSDIRLVSARRGRPHVARLRTEGEVLEWGARLAPDDTPFGTILDAAAGAAALVCVCPGMTNAVGPLSAAAEALRPLVVLVEGDAAESQLRNAGATVASLRTDEIERWFATGCPAS